MSNTIVSPILAFLNFSTPEIVVIALVILLLFGAKRLPELARGIGKSLKEFKKATSEVEGEIRSAMDEEPVRKQTSPATEYARAHEEHDIECEQGDEGGHHAKEAKGT